VSPNGGLLRQEPLDAMSRYVYKMDDTSVEGITDLPAIPPDVNSAIGHVITRFNLLEIFLREVLVRFLSPDRGSAQLVAFSDDRFDWLRRQLLAQAGLKIRSTPLREEWSRFMAQIQELQEERNRLVHDLWMPVANPDGTFQLQRTRLRLQRGKVVPEIEHMPGDHVYAIAQDASDRFLDLIAFIPRLEAEGILYPTRL